ncbi:MAG: nitrogenase [Clostridiales Family XIII bacterium]|jgi:nitrogenase molybdenum-iron protein alpha chain|nr:nitrogenase [Clostridiales Family XIII bacterium]
MAVKEINFDHAEVVVREERLGSVSQYRGTVYEVAKAGEEVSGGGCGFSDGDRCFSQNSGCMNGCAQYYLTSIDNVAVVNHAPIGCGADFSANNNSQKWGEAVQGRPHKDIIDYSTNMQENDTVFGAADKLTETIRAAYNENDPDAIFITTSCVSAVIGEDIGSVADNMTAELGIPVIPVSCEGFKSRIWASGFDAAFHALLTGICKPPRRKTDTVNVINFRGTATPEFYELFEHLGLTPRLVVAYNTVEELSKMPEAIATVSVCGTLGSYLGNGLEQRYGVPYVKSMQPHGVAGFEDWVRQLAKATGRTERGEEFIEKSREKYLPQIAELKRELTGIRAVVAMGPGFAFNFSRVALELGIVLENTHAWHLDTTYDSGRAPESVRYLARHNPGLRVSVSNLQYNEVINALAHIRPDLYIYRHPTNSGLIMKLGIPTLSLIDEYTAVGYRGLIEFGRQIKDVMLNRNFEKKLAAKTKLPYTDWWIEQSDPQVFCADGGRANV